MNLESFFQKFDQFADAPGAVAKMREVVLNLAVTGRLSEKRAGDEPVSELVSALSASKALRGKHGRRGGAAKAPTESIIDRPIHAPAHWVWVPLNDIGAMSGGMTPSKDKSVFWEGAVNWFSSKDIKSDELRESELKITREATEATGLQVYSPGCLVMVARSGILKRTFPVSILRVEATVNQDLKVLSPFVGGIERYLQIMLRGLTGFILTSLVKTGMTVQSLKYDEFEAQPFPIPPLAEQKRIVAKVDELMALCDRLEAQQEERETRHAALSRASLACFAKTPTSANLNFIFHKSYDIPPADLRTSILTLAVRGKLVPQDPTEQPAQELLKQVSKARGALAERGDVKTKVQLAAIDSDQEPYPIPDSWSWVPLNELTELVYGKLLPTTELLPSGFQVFGANGIIGCFSKYLYENEMLLISCRGAYSGTPNISPPKSYVTNNSIVCEFFEPRACEIRFFHSVLAISPREKIVTGSAQPQVTVANAIKLPVPVPPLAEQRRIVAKVEHLISLVDTLEAQLDASRATAASLLAALVAELTQLS